MATLQTPIFLLTIIVSWASQRGHLTPTSNHWHSPALLGLPPIPHHQISHLVSPDILRAPISPALLRPWAESLHSWSLPKKPPNVSLSEPVVNFQPNSEQSILNPGLSSVEGRSPRLTAPMRNCRLPPGNQSGKIPERVLNYVADL